MSEKQDIDKFFKERLYNRSFEFDESAWSGAEKLLDQHDRKNRGFWKGGAYGLIALLFISGAAYLAINQTGTPENRTALAVSEDAVQQDHSSAELSAQPSHDINEQVANETSPVTNTDNQSPVVSSGASPAGKIQGQGMSSDSRLPSTTAAGSNERAVKPAGVSSGKDATQDPNSLAKQDNPDLSADRPVKPDHGKKSPLKSGAAKNKPEPTGINGNNSYADTNPNRRNVRPKRVGELPSSDIAKSSLSREIGMERMESIQPSIVVEHEKDILKGKMDLKEKENPFAGGMMSRWSVIAGGGYGMVSNAPETDKSAANATVLFAGLGYAHYLTPKFSLHGNLLYTHYRDLNVAVERTSETYDFGFHYQQTVITTRKLSYVSLPVFINYYVGGRYNIYAGAQYSHLMRVISDRQVTSEDNFGVTADDAKGEGVYRDHFRSGHVSFLCGFDYLLNERVGLGLRYNHGLTRMMNSGYINNDKYNLNDIKLTLTINMGN